MHAEPRRLIVSIHDVSPATMPAVTRLADLLRPLLGGAAPAMLVVPDHGGRGRIDADAAFCERLRGWADAGAEIFLHGWFHRDEARHTGALARFKAHHMTAREGEFLGLHQAEAERRILAGRALIEAITSRPIAGFVAPAWLYGEGARTALRTTGIRIAEDHLRVWDPASGRILSRGPVVTWASRTRWRTASSLAVAAVARVGFGRLPTVRVAVHPGDVTKPALLDSIARTVAALAAERRVSRYADLEIAA